MSNDPSSRTDADARRYDADVEGHLGRSMTESERRLARSLMNDKSAAIVARELLGAPITDPKKMRPEHKDTADEPSQTR